MADCSLKIWSLVIRVSDRSEWQDQANVFLHFDCMIYILSVMCIFMVFVLNFYQIHRLCELVNQRTW